MNLDEFLKSSHRSAWLVEGDLDLFVRRGDHLINGEIASCFDLANFHKPEASWGSKTFWNFLADLKSKLGSHPEFKYLFVESVLNPRLEASLPHHGFKLVPNSLPSSFYLNLP